jgi:hypothetical protein
MSKIVPVYSEESKQNFVSSELVAPTEVVVGDVKIKTAPLLFNKKISLLGISHSPELECVGVHGQTDSVDPVLYVNSVILQAENGDVLEHCFTKEANGSIMVVKGAFFEPSLQGPTGKMLLNVTTYSEPVLHTATSHNYRYKLSLVGAVDIETSEVEVRASVENLPNGGTNFLEVTPIGYTLIANRRNHNR